MPIDFQLIEKDGGVTNRAVTSWERGEGGFTASFDVKHRINRNSFEIFNTTSTSFSVDGIKPGTTFEVQVRAVGVGFPPKTSKYVRATAIAPDLPKQIPGNPDDTIGDAVPNVSSLSLAPVDDKRAVLQWVSPANARLNNLIAIVRHSRKTDGTGTYADSTKLIDVPVQLNQVSVPLLNGEYLIKLKDQTTKRLSETAVSVVVSNPDSSPGLITLSIREDLGDSPFGSGSYKRGVFYSDLYDGLVLDGDALWDRDVPGNIDDLSGIDFIGTRNLSGEYEFSSILDLGGKFQVSLDRVLGNRGLYPSDLIDDRAELLDSWTDFDGFLAEDTSATIYFRSSDGEVKQDDVGLEDGSDLLLLEDGTDLKEELSTAFTAWRVLDRNTFVGRTFQFKVELETDHVDQTPIVDELGFTVTIPSRVENGSLQVSGAAAKAVTFANAFYEAPSVGITAFNLLSGDYYEITSVTRTGFTVHFKDSSNLSVDRNFQYVAAGFGSEQT